MHKILIVDDDRMNLILAKKFLEKEGYEVVTKNSGKDALEWLETDKSDLILLDIQMPLMDGFEVMAQLQINPDTISIPVVFLTADRNEKTEEACLAMGAQDFVNKPFVPAIMLQRIRRTLELVDYKKHLETLVETQLQKITKLQSDIIITMANLIEGRDGTTGEHVKRVSAYVSYMLSKLKAKGIYQDQLTSRYCDYVRRAAPMHDIGKITIPDKILQKQGSLSTEEYEIMKLHTTYGGNLIIKNEVTLGEAEFVKIAFEMASYHHEKWNGEGYPNKFKEKQIPLCARILAVCDVFDALVSERPYKKALSIRDAIEIMKKDSGKLFEPCLLEAFISDPEELEEMLVML